MASPTTATPALSDTEIARLLETLKGADSVELKLTVPEPHQRSPSRRSRARSARRPDPTGLLLRHARPRRSTATASSYARGGSRARVATRSSSCARWSPTELPADLRLSNAFRVEVDALPGGFVCSGTLKGTPDPADVLQRGKGSLAAAEALLEGAAAALRGARARRSRRSTTSPSSGRSSSSSCASCRRSSSAGSWPRCGSTRTARAFSSCRRGATTSEAFQVAAETRAFLVERGVDLSGEQETKTRKALEYFSRELKKASK